MSSPVSQITKTEKQEWNQYFVFIKMVKKE